MTDVTRWPDGDGTLQWPVIYPASPTTHFSKVTDADNDDTTYLETDESMTSRIDRFTKPVLGLPVGATITNVAVCARARRVKNVTWPTVPTITLGLYFGGSDYFAASSESLTDSYVDYARNWAGNPAGGSWSETDVDNMLISLKGQSNRILKFGLYYYSVARATQVWIVVSYTVGAGPVQSMLVQVM